MDIINIDGKKYEYYEFNNDVEVLDRLFDLKIFLDVLNKDIELQKVIYELVIFKDNEIQAFSTKTNSKYLLGISEGALRELRNWFKQYFSKDETYAVFGLNRNNEHIYYTYTYQKALEFLIAHEYVHVANGHCDISQNEQKTIYEQAKEISQEEGLFSQTLEFDADIWAVAYLVDKIVNENIPEEEKIEKLKLFVFAIYTVFRKFSDKRKYDFDEFINDDLLKSTHPTAEIRYRYIMTTILTNISNSSQEHEYMVKKELVYAFMDFESQILGYKEVNEKLFRLAHTSNGTNHLILLHNNWIKVATELEEYRTAKLNITLPIGKELDALVLINNDGEII